MPRRRSSVRPADHVCWVAAVLAVTMAIILEATVFAAASTDIQDQALSLLGWLLGVDVLVAGALGWLLHRQYDPTRRLALGALLLADASWKLALLRIFEPSFDVWWFTGLQLGTLLFLVGTGVVTALFFTGRQRLWHGLGLWKIR